MKDDLPEPVEQSEDQIWPPVLVVLVAGPAAVFAVGTWWIWQPYGEPIEGGGVFLPFLHLDKLGPTFANYFTGVLLGVAWALPAAAIAWFIQTVIRRIGR